MLGSLHWKEEGPLLLPALVPKSTGSELFYTLLETINNNLVIASAFVAFIIVGIAFIVQKVMDPNEWIECERDEPFSVERSAESPRDPDELTEFMGNDHQSKTSYRTTSPILPQYQSPFVRTPSQRGEYQIPRGNKIQSNGDAPVVRSTHSEAMVIPKDKKKKKGVTIETNADDMKDDGRDYARGSYRVQKGDSPKAPKRRFSNLFRRSSQSKNQGDDKLPALPAPTVSPLQLNTDSHYPYPPSPYSPPTPCPSEPQHVLDQLYEQQQNSLSLNVSGEHDWAYGDDGEPMIGKMYSVIGSMYHSFLDETFENDLSSRIKSFSTNVVLLLTTILLSVCTISLATILVLNFELFVMAAATLFVALMSGHFLVHLGY